MLFSLSSTISLSSPLHTSRVCLFLSQSNCPTQKIIMPPLVAWVDPPVSEGDTSVSAVDDQCASESNSINTVPASLPHFLDGPPVREIPGDLFNAPMGSGLLRSCYLILSTNLMLCSNLWLMFIFPDACNCSGAWGAGIAKAFKQKVCRLFTAVLVHLSQSGDAFAQPDGLGLYLSTRTTMPCFAYQ